ncbi:glycosyltransferase [Kribbella solani]|uniref:glycosyltransferase n=1 Tax=Kribbella solani TaxID=236067 RepID=UPI0029B69081|nr:glycosyltransferase [Kribbella solani]MDX2971545.1 glycosyltransferase [Kribbella solani]
MANNVINDSRVLKEAAVLVDAGLRVTVLGVSLDEHTSVDRLESGAVMVRLPGTFTFRDGRRRRRQRRRDWRLPLLGGHIPGELVVRKALLEARRAELNIGAGRGPRLLGHRARQLVFAGARARGLLIRHQNRAFKLGWRVWDGVVARTPWAVSWPGTVPEAYDYETIFGPVIDRLDPDVIHAHDMHTIGVAVRAAARSARAVPAILGPRVVKVVYDAHEYVPGIARYGARTPRFIAAWARHERDYLPVVDRVVTVSPAIAERLRREHALDRLPDVILNTPDLPEPNLPEPNLPEPDVLGPDRFGVTAPIGADIRGRIGLPAGVPLIVYSGGITVVRGIDTAIRALPKLPGVHLAVVAVPSPDLPGVDVLRKLAADVGVTERVHFLHPVGPREVTAFLRTADAGIIPMLRAPNHEMALPNKLFEYSLGGLPVLVSDMASLREFVTRTGIGEVFAAGDSADFAAKCTVLLGHLDSYRLTDPAFREEAAWSGQAARLRSVYADLLDRDVKKGEGRAGSDDYKLVRRLL